MPTTKKGRRRSPSGASVAARRYIEVMEGRRDTISNADALALLIQALKREQALDEESAPEVERFGVVRAALEMFVRAVAAEPEWYLSGDAGVVLRIGGVDEVLRVRVDGFRDWVKRKGLSPDESQAHDHQHKLEAAVALVAREHPEWCAPDMAKDPCVAPLRRLLNLAESTFIRKISKVRKNLRGLPAPRPGRPPGKRKSD